MIRRAQIKDTEKILDLLVQVCHVHATGRPDIFNDYRTKYTADQLHEIMEDPGKVILVNTDENDEVMGYMFGVYQQHINDNVLTDIKTLYIDDICVDENHRRKHVGRQLYDATIQLAKDTGCYNVTLNVWALNPTAQSFYESCGMHVLKTMMEEVL